MADRLSEKKVRISITPTKEICAQIDDMAHRMGMSRSATCSMLIASALESFNAMNNLTPNQLRIITEVLGK